MCNICTESDSDVATFDCPEIVEWPDSPFTPEEQATEEREWREFKEANPEAAREMFDTNCEHPTHHEMVQDWQGVDVLVVICGTCGATNLLTEGL